MISIYLQTPIIFNSKLFVTSLSFTTLKLRSSKGFCMNEKVNA